MPAPLEEERFTRWSSPTARPSRWAIFLLPFILRNETHGNLVLVEEDEYGRSMVRVPSCLPR